MGGAHVLGLGTEAAVIDRILWLMIAFGLGGIFQTYILTGHWWVMQ